MGREFAYFTTNPEVQRHAMRAHATRNECIADAFKWLARLWPSHRRNIAAEPRSALSA